MLLVYSTADWQSSDSSCTFDARLAKHETMWRQKALKSNVDSGQWMGEVRGKTGLLVRAVLRGRRLKRLGVVDGANFWRDWDYKEIGLKRERGLYREQAYDERVVLRGTRYKSLGDLERKQTCRETGRWEIWSYRKGNHRARECLGRFPGYILQDWLTLRHLCCNTWGMVFLFQERGEGSCLPKETKSSKCFWLFEDEAPRKVRNCIPPMESTDALHGSKHESSASNANVASSRWAF